MKRFWVLELSRSEQSHAFSVDEENKLWEEGVLGNSSPQVLLDTMVFQCGIISRYVLTKSTGV